MIYSLVSLILALATEAVLITGIFWVTDIVQGENPAKSGMEKIVEEAKEEEREIEEAEKNETKEQKQEQINERVPLKGLANEGVIASGSRKSFLDRFEKIRKIIYLVMIVAILIYIAIFLCYFHMFTRNTSDYLAEISDGIDEIAKGDFHKSVRIVGEDEIANIAEKINNMSKEIQILIENERNYEKEKSDLITNVAHDLRTPLTSIIGYLELVKGKTNLGNADREKYVSIAYDKSKRLEKLINDLFEFTKVGAEKIHVNPVSLDFKRFMEQMVEEFYPSFEEVGLECIVHNQLKEGKLMADPDLLARGIANLFSNAVKYGKDGKVIKVNLKEDKKNIYLKLTNFGEIIPEEDLEHIFDKFFRVENSRSMETGGTGLGLAIAKKVILLHHGKINVSSDYKGTVFSIELPKE